MWQAGSEDPGDFLLELSQFSFTFNKSERFFFSILMKVICTFMGEEQGNFQLLLIGLNEPHSGADGDVIWY